MRLQGEGSDRKKIIAIGLVVALGAVYGISRMNENRPATANNTAETTTQTETTAQSTTENSATANNTTENSANTAETASAGNAANSAATTDSAASNAATKPGTTQVKAADSAPAKDVTELQKVDVVVGKGKEAKPGDHVTVHYRGKLTNGSIFDESYKRGQPFDFDLGAGQVIQGWDQGVAGMKEGGKRKLTIPGHLAYGANGTPDGTIPPNATLIFDVELLKVG